MSARRKTVGAALVGLALIARDGDGVPVSYRAKLVLVKMAHVALDEDLSGDSDPLYFGGWPALAEGLGYSEFTPAAERSVARALADLRAAGLVSPDETSTRRRNAAYRLHLGRAFRRTEPADREWLSRINARGHVDTHDSQVVQSVENHPWVRNDT